MDSFAQCQQRRKRTLSRRTSTNAAEAKSQSNGVGQEQPRGRCIRGRRCELSSRRFAGQRGRAMKNADHRESTEFRQATFNVRGAGARAVLRTVAPGSMPAGLNRNIRSSGQKLTPGIELSYYMSSHNPSHLPSRTRGIHRICERPVRRQRADSAPPTPAKAASYA